MTAWPDLLATALLGTDRRALASEVDDPAGALLDEAAAWSVYRRAGVQPVRELGMPVPAPAESTPIVGPLAAARLSELVDAGSYVFHETSGALIAEWLAVTAVRRRRMPPEILPDLLHLARRRPELRPLVIAAAGARAAWLAAQNPEWTYLTATTDESGAGDPATWHEGTSGQRAGYLIALRRTDPSAGRALLADEWPRLPPDERARFLAVLATGLGADDEEFLESALDDRRQEVRAVAADLLAGVPGSAYNARMANRAQSYLRVRGRSVVVEPPAQCDAAMRRDGIIVRPYFGLGERTWWLEQVLARTPLSTFGGGDPAAFFGLSLEDGWVTTVLRGLAQAAAGQGNAAWAEALLDRMEQRPQEHSRDHSLVEALYAALEPAEVGRRAIAAMGDDTAARGRLIEAILEHCPAPWSDELARAVLAGFEAHARHKKMPYHLDRAREIASFRMPPEFAPEAARAVDRFRTDMPDHGRVDVFERLASTLQLRHEMIREIT